MPTSDLPARVVCVSVRYMMFGYGDVPNPAPDTVDVLEELTTGFITDIVRATPANRRHSVRHDTYG